MKTELIKNKKYKLTFKIGNEILYFTGKIIEDNEETVKFLDKFNQENSLKKEFLIFTQEVNK